MSSNPFNVLPIDPAWVAQGDTMAEETAKAMRCAVVTIAVQQDGKLGVFVANPQGAGREVGELLKDKLPLFFANLSMAMQAVEFMRQHEAKH